MNLMTWATVALAAAAWLGVVPLGIRATVLMLRKRRKRKNQEWWGMVGPAVAFSVIAIALLQSLSERGKE
jgi:hypothetical protein